MSVVRKAVLPVAGRGTRFLPATKAVPKELLPVVDRPLVDYAIEEAREAGIEEFIFVTGRGKDSIADHLDADPELVRALEDADKRELAQAVRACELADGKAVFVRQSEPLGLGHAVWCARSCVGDEPFAVILPDDLIQADTPCMAQMLEAHARTGGNLAAVVDVPREQTKRYGILDVEADDGALVRVRALVEKPDPAAAPSTLAIIGRYVLDPAIFAELEKGRTGAGGEIQLTDAMMALIGRKPFHGVRFEGTRFDCGSKEGFLEATVAFALARPELAATMREIAERALRPAAAPKDIAAD